MTPSLHPYGFVRLLHPSGSTVVLLPLAPPRPLVARTLPWSPSPSVSPGLSVPWTPPGPQISRSLLSVGRNGPPRLLLHHCHRGALWDLVSRLFLPGSYHHPLLQRSLVVLVELSGIVCVSCQDAVSLPSLYMLITLVLFNKYFCFGTFRIFVIFVRPKRYSCTLIFQ